LRRVLGKSPLYLNMLRKFVTGHSDAAAVCRQALDALDRQTAERTMHTLRGVAGNIGAEDIQALAGEIEVAIRNDINAAQVFAQLERLATALATLSDALQPYLTEANVAESIFDQNKVHAVIEKLAALLQASSAETNVLLLAEQRLLAAVFPAHYARLAESINSFDFDSAESILQSARQTLAKEKDI